MMTAILVHLPLVILPLLHLPAPMAVCRYHALAAQGTEAEALTEFNAAVDRYVALHRRVEHRLPPERMFEDVEEMFAARAALRSAILDARPNAAPGNVFTPRVAPVIVELLDRTIADSGYEPEEVLAAINEERPPGLADPVVNGEFPWAIGSAMWPIFLRVLPTLPEELEYRFSDRDLVLIDIHANLVVDILENALPAGRDNDVLSDFSLLLASRGLPGRDG
jgi:hypothetical protein